MEKREFKDALFQFKPARITNNGQKEKIIASIRNEKIEVSYPLAYRSYVLMNSADKDGKVAVDYAERWALLMQLEFKSEKKLSGKLTNDLVVNKLSKKLANDLASKANIEGINNLQYRCAVAILLWHWKYGIALGEVLGFDKSNVIRERQNISVENARLSKVTRSFNNSFGFGGLKQIDIISKHCKVSIENALAIKER